jgi:two-component system, OmpR family, sensor histidine kinase KdpD
VRIVLPSSRTPSLVRVAVLALAVPALAAGVAHAFPGAEALTAAVLLLMGVVVASTIGGVRAGFGAAVCSFLLLNFFFTTPRGTLRVAHLEDGVALAVFLAVAALVGALVARAVDERDRASRRESERAALTEIGSRLAVGEPLPRALQGMAQAVVELFDLAGCAIEIQDSDGVRRAEAGDIARLEGGPAIETIELRAGAVRLGSMLVREHATGRHLTAEDRRLLRAIAGQAVLAIERSRLDAEVRGALLASEANRLRAAIFASVSHDLRTPLASITAATSSLLEDEAVHSVEQRHELLATIAEEAERLNRVVGNIIDLARIRSGTLTLDLQLVPLDEIIHAVLARLRPLLDAFTVRTVMRPDLPMVAVDPVQVDQVLSNLLENAARYSPPGGEIVVSAGAWQSRLIVRVIDRGPGIPVEDRERVFEEFRRGGSGRGVGLGLSIARAIVQAHGGRIWIESSPGGGATLAFELPLDPQAPMAGDNEGAR